MNTLDSPLGWVAFAVLSDRAALLVVCFGLVPMIGATQTLGADHGKQVANVHYGQLFQLPLFKYWSRFGCGNAVIPAAVDKPSPWVCFGSWIVRLG
jgi:hypothetical protein